MNKIISFFLCLGIIFPFIFLKDIYPFHRFGMFAEPIKHQTQYEKFHLFYKNEADSNFTELRPQNIPLNANTFEMQLRKHHYQAKHADFITVFDEIIKDKENLKQNKNLKWKWYHIIQKDSNNEIDSLCVFSN
ncbi:hypothetical protein WAF17_17100 [Bernardetia sp. ABR2-2B]|uniref:hypothetical protein n=1 Tax=Bernardetia sp. ABR2-2B TaxID=3127472 RepID=UPI0030CB4E08